MTQHADFEVFEFTARLAGGAGEGTFLRAYTRFDSKLLGALKNKTNAYFRKDADGRGHWTHNAESPYADEFRACIARAAARTNGAAPVAATAPAAAKAPASRASAERAYDLGMNEGGEGFNPHRHGSAHTYR